MKRVTASQLTRRTTRTRTLNDQPSTSGLAALPQSVKRIADIEGTRAPTFSTAEILEVRTSLLQWYDQNHRTLPWRRNPHSLKHMMPACEDGAVPASDALDTQQFMYQVWICEVMSQQTQLARVVEYFTRWVHRWPTVQDLAQASLDDVNAEWAGLGYYRRARFLLEGAQYVMTKLAGAFPLTSKELQKIPGIGPYTGNAIASIACGERVAVVDANVVRVLARLRCLNGDPSTSAAAATHAALANQLLDPARPGDFNQAIMELGATTCTANQPASCDACPLHGHCAAYAAARQGRGGLTGDVASVMLYPPKVEKAKRREEFVAVCVVRHQGADYGAEPSYLMIKRPEKGLLAGLWEFPSEGCLPGEHPESCAALAKLLDGVLGSSLSAGSRAVASRQRLGNVVHIFSHIRMTMHVELLSLQGARPPLQLHAMPGSCGARWVSNIDSTAASLSSGSRKVFGLVKAADEQIC